MTPVQNNTESLSMARTMCPLSIWLLMSESLIGEDLRPDVDWAFLRGSR